MAAIFPELYGAKGDGVQFDTKAIQQAIDECSIHGGGRVCLSSGQIYLSGSILLKENVELHLEKGAVLKASSRLEDYYQPGGDIDNENNKRVGTPVTRKPAFAFLYALNQNNIAITGTGSIDGNAFAFVKRVNRYYVTGDFYPRPTIVYVENCHHISFSDITFHNTSFWTLHTAGCNDVAISGIRILHDMDIANSDGIDIDHSQNVRIQNCHIECADDCICLKNTAGNREYDHTKNVIISNCTLSSTSAAIKIGTEGVDPFENVIVDNCIVTKSNRGISIQIRDQGLVRNISFSNIMIETRRFSEEWWGTGEPIAITTFDRDKETKSGSISDIRFTNITCKGENGIFISGNEQNRINNISFDTLSVTLIKNSKWAVGKYDLRPGIEEPAILSTLSPGIYLRYADEISFKNTVVKYDADSKQHFGEVIRSENSTGIRYDYE